MGDPQRGIADGLLDARLICHDTDALSGIHGQVVVGLPVRFNLHPPIGVTDEAVVGGVGDEDVLDGRRSLA